MKAAPKLNVDLLKGVRVGDLKANEFDKLRAIATRFGDVTIIGDKSTLYSLYELSKNAQKKSEAVARRNAARNLEKFVLSAAAARQLYYREYVKEGGKVGKTTKFALTRIIPRHEDELKGKKKKAAGEKTDIFE